MTGDIDPIAFTDLGPELVVGGLLLAAGATITVAGRRRRRQDRPQGRAAA